MEDLRQKILYLRDVVKLSFYQIEEQTGIPRKKASKIYKGQPVKDKKNNKSKLNKYHNLISNWFKEYPSLKALQVYNWLKERDPDMSYSLVAQYTKSFRKKKEKLYHHLNFLPGEEGQVDWAIINHPELGRLYCFVLILSYSRYLFAHLFPRHSFEFFIEGHLMAFKAFSGTPRSLRYDNLKSVVLKRKPEIQYNPQFLDFCRYYKVNIRLCNPGAGNEKGRVERAIRTLKENFFNVNSDSSLKAVNQGLVQWVKEKNHSIHRATGKRPEDLFQEEKLRPLPVNPFNNVMVHPPVKTTKTGMMIFDTNSYSVPEYLVNQSLSIHSNPTRLHIYDKNNKVASHPRSFKRNEKIINPLHRNYTALSAKAKLERIYDVIKNMHPALDEFLLKNQTLGEDNKKTAYQFFKLLKLHSRSMVVSIAQECLNRKSPRLKTFLSYLNADSEDSKEPVHPHNSQLLNISYNPRPLEEYDDEES